MLCAFLVLIIVVLGVMPGPLFEAIGQALGAAALPGR
jgi:NADH:ubiquinone oxidoreductase subunit 4 (subunit M)